MKPLTLMGIFLTSYLTGAINMYVHSGLLYVVSQVFLHFWAASTISIILVSETEALWSSTKTAQIAQFASK